MTKYICKNPMAERSNYLTDRALIVGSHIVEYDIKQANINILNAYGQLSGYDYSTLAMADKMTREVMIGRKIQREKMDKKESVTYECIADGTKRAKDMLLMSNDIKDHEIIRIANDAIYIERFLPLGFTEFDILNNNHTILFRPKGVYTSMVKLGRVIVFMGIKSDGEFEVDVKGISEENIELHQAFLGQICEILFYLERSGLDAALRSYQTFFKNYIEMKLPIEYYREFNADSSFRVKSPTKNYGIISMGNPRIEMIDTNYNLSLLRDFYAMLVASSK